MKKLLTAICILMLIAAMSVNVFAEDKISSLGGSNTQDVIATYKINSGVYKSIYSIDISWSISSFTYDGGTWDSDKHIYVGAGWTYSPDANRITVTNHSNVKIKAAFSYTSKPEFSNITGTFYDSNAENAKQITELILDMPAPVTDGAAISPAPSGSVYLRLSGSLFESNVKLDSSGTVHIGTVTITLTAVNT